MRKVKKYSIEAINIGKRVILKMLIEYRILASITNKF